MLDARDQFRGYIRKRIEDPGLAEDILQDSLLRAIRAAPELRDEERLIPWFYRVLQNAIVDAYRRRGVERAHVVVADAPEIAAEPEDDAELCRCFERLIVTYAADGPRYFYDPTYDCTPLWEGHVDYSPALYERFWGPGGQFETFDPATSFPQISAPVLIAHGVFDFSVPPTIWVGMKEKLPNHTYRAFERSGHYPHLEERAAFSSAVTAWHRHT